MDVILLEKIENLGAMGDLVKVKPGFGRNYLIPQGKAAVATPENIAEFESRRAELEKHSTDALTAAVARRDELSGMKVTITARAGEEGKLFGSVGTTDIAESISAVGVAVERSEVRLPEGALRMTGEHEVQLHLHADVNATILVLIEAE